ncbi:hypothetical protein QYM23_02685 [Bacillus cereus]|uniref:Group-specific protein n=1 Tax=Bacillus cereus TaxID=1396 RepID=A0AAW7NBK2_BACCE|nr:hypothetical protein [Bacillus cereus]MDN4871807.1 hypothetical protein [Bacillus cereus]
MNIVAINSNKIQRKVMNDLKGYWALDEWKIEEFLLPDRRGKIKETKKLLISIKLVMNILNWR